MPTQFAGWSWPRKIPRLVSPDYCGLPEPLARLDEARRTLQQVAAKMGRFAYDRHLPRHQFKVNTSYYAEPQLGQRETFFYLGSDFTPGLRWKWADEVEDASIGHKGWYSDAFCDDTIRGFVMALPHSRGFLAGWSMGEGMASAVSYEIHETEQRAAYRADQWAERVADDERAASEAEMEDEDQAEAA
jgi:hypothetical protein